MKFLIVNNLSPNLSNYLSSEGFDSIHVKDIKMQNSEDEEIFRKAYDDKRIVVSADTDFGFILSKWKLSLPSVILFRHHSTLPEKQVKNLITIINNFRDELIRGALIIIEPTKTRVKALPY